MITLSWTENARWNEIIAPDIKMKWRNMKMGMHMVEPFLQKSNSIKIVNHKTKPQSTKGSCMASSQGLKT